MHSVVYGHTRIKYNIQENDRLKGHYITVERHSGVVLKGKVIKKEIADRLILKKAKWIINKMQLVKAVNESDIVTGSRIPYLGKRYYAEVKFSNRLKNRTINFTHSRFIITVNPKGNVKQEIHKALELFYREKAEEKITPRIKKLSNSTGLKYKSLRFIKMSKRWGSCTGKDTIIINPKAIQLPYSLIDYLLIHELCHTKIKSHSKAFWKELGKHCRGWKKLDHLIHIR